MSDGQLDAINRINDVSPWYLVDGATRIFPSKGAITAAGPAVPIALTELGTAPPVTNVWTATSSSGARSANTCQSWTSSSNRDIQQQPRHGRHRNRRRRLDVDVKRIPDL
jgi:hypothetical protein